MSATPRARRGIRLALVFALVALGCGTDAVARGGGGGGGFGGGGYGGGAGAGGGMAQSSIAGANRSAAGAGRADGPGADRGRPDAGRDRDRRNPGVGIDGGVDPDYDIDAGRIQHPVLAIAVIRNIGVTEGGVAGTYYYSLPSAGCVEETVNDKLYIRCTSVYYEEVWSGNELLYVVVVP